MSHLYIHFYDTVAVKFPTKCEKYTFLDVFLILPTDMTLLLVFHRKDLCEAKHEMQSVSKFSDVLFALKSDGPPVEASSGQEWY